MKDETNTGVIAEDDNSKNDDAHTKQFLTFRVEKEEYGVELMTIREIKGWTKPTQLPNSPNFMKGVINLRGVVIPIFDLRHRFDMGQTEPDEKNVVIIIAVGKKLIGVLVDAVSDILSATDDQIKPAPAVEAKIDEEFVQGLISVEDKMVVLLNIEKLFDSETLAQAERISSKANISEKTTNEQTETSEEQNAKKQETEITDDNA